LDVGKKQHMSKTTKTTLAAILATSIATFAGTSVQTTEGSNFEPSFSGVYGVDVSSGFVNKGRLFDSNPVFQPFGSIIIPTSLEIGGGIRTSVVGSSRQQLHTESPLSTWARSEVNVGFVFTKDRLSFIPTYELVTSSNRSYRSSQGVNLTLEFDDVGLTPLPIKPHARAYIGTKSGFERLANYFEVGISPTVAAGSTTVSFPVNLGVGTNNFYTGGERYGYTSAGVATSTPLCNKVSLVTGVTYFNTNENINNGKKDLWLTSAGIAVQF
jgi:hypothetical protein